MHIILSNLNYQKENHTTNQTRQIQTTRSFKNQYYKNYLIDWVFRFFKEKTREKAEEKRVGDSKWGEDGDLLK